MKRIHPILREISLDTPLLALVGEPVIVTCPAIECLLGDKLTAFAPHTTGIQYGLGKELDIAKQLFDIGLLFDVAGDIELVSVAFETIAAQELIYRALNNLTILDVLRDAFDTACLIGLRGVGSPHKYNNSLRLPQYRRSASLRSVPSIKRIIS